MTISFRTISLAAALLALTSCASGPGPQGGPERRPGGQNGGGSGFDRANAMLANGRYEQAHDGFLCISQQGSGYEIALHSAGMASLAHSEDAALPAEARAALQERGLLELIRASDAGWPASQAELVQRFHARGDDAALDRAAYWLAVLDSNTRDMALGLERIPAAQRRQIEESIGAERLALQHAEARLFTVEMLVREPSNPACAPWISVSRPQQRGQRGQQRGGRGPGGGGGRGSGGGRGPRG